MTITIFQDGRIFDGNGEELIEGMSVVVEGNQIVDIVRQTPDLRDAVRIDCRGKVVMPGMIDNHVHIYANSLASYVLPEPPMTYRAQYARNFLGHILSCGFTTVRDVGGGDHGMAMALRDGYLDGPRFFYGGLCLTQTGGHGDLRAPSQAADICACAAEQNFFAVHADGVDACIRAAREELRKGASHIKIMASGGVMSPNDPLDRSQYSDAEISAIVDECARRGSYVAAHCHPADAIRRCVALGVRSIEHGTLIDAETAAYVAAEGAYVVPTMAVLFALAEEGEGQGVPAAMMAKLEPVMGSALEGLSIMKRAGVKMGFGTDLLGEQHRRHSTEFSLRGRVLGAIDILRSATSINAEILQMDGRLGVIREGALADILVVDGNPLERIEVLADPGRSITHIMADGRIVKAISS
jgi:imidazolonepropionase-like amidohydrolase